MPMIAVMWVSSIWFVAASTEIDVLDSISRLSVIAFLIIALYGLHKQWWVLGWQYRDLLTRHELLRTQRDKALENADSWKEQALTASSVANQSTTIATAAIRRGQEGQA